MKTFRTLARTLAFHAGTSNTDLGAAGERLAIAYFEDCGFLAKKSRTIFEGDLAVTDKKTGECFKVEVKTAKKGHSRNRWQFNINSCKTSCVYSDYVLIFAVKSADVVAYFLPAKALKDKKVIQITDPDKYRGFLAKYRVSGELSLEKAWELYNA